MAMSENKSIQQKSILGNNINQNFNKTNTFKYVSRSPSISETESDSDECPEEEFYDFLKFKNDEIEIMCNVNKGLTHIQK